jgi:hypothetical protein
MPRQYTPRVAVPCAWCGQPFYCQPSTAHRHKFCGRACRTASVLDGAKNRLLTRGRRTESGCLVWTGCLDSHGYGKMGVGSVLKKVHSFAYEVFIGPIPDGHGVHHLCNNPPCYEPTHLTTGTTKQNAAYMVACGRSLKGDRSPSRRYPERRQRGEANPHAKLTAVAVSEIRARYAIGGISQHALAAEYGLSQGSIGDIIRRITWAHVA